MNRLGIPYRLITVIHSRTQVLEPLENALEIVPTTVIGNILLPVGWTLESGAGDGNRTHVRSLVTY